MVAKTLNGDFSITLMLMSVISVKNLRSGLKMPKLDKVPILVMPNYVLKSLSALR
jgi:hypothetical protein